MKIVRARTAGFCMGVSLALQKLNSALEGSSGRSRSAEPPRICTLGPIIHNPQVLAEYGEDFYAGLPCLTKHAFGAGQAYYLAAKPEQDGLDAIYTAIAAELSLPKAMQEKLPTGVIATERGGAAFVQNYSGKTQQVTLDGSYEEMLRDPAVEVVYIATPHSLHYRHIKLCADHGKHILCEKPFTVSARQDRKSVV